VTGATDAPRTLPDLLAATAARHGDRTALISGDRRLTWGDVADDVRRRAGGLAGRGVGPGDAVALVLPNDVEFVTTFLAVGHLGAVAVPLNPGFTVAELGGHLAGTGARGIVTGPGLLPTLGPWAEAGGAGPGVWVAGAADLPAPAADAPPVAAVPDGPALHAFSSGSTGTPKGIVRTQANLVAEADQFYDTVGVGEDDVILSLVALFHAHGLGNCVQAAVRSGAAMVLVDQFRRDAVLAAIESERVSIFPSVPFVCHTLGETRRAERADTRSLRLCFTAGAPLARETYDLFRARFGVSLRQLYGCSEAGSVTINLDDDADGLAGSVGRPMKGIDLSVLGEDGTPRAPGETGEVTFASPAATTGYVGGEPGAERPSFAGGWFRSGDLGHLDRAGNLYVTGRSKLFISTSGYKVDPVEVEDVLRRHPEVAEVVVVGSEGLRGEEVVKAVVVPHSPGGDEGRLRRELLALCRDRLAVHKVPRIVELRDELPRSPLGKILRKYLV
jgi:long-chain acyl-CoA synthetase